VKRLTRVTRPRLPHEPPPGPAGSVRRVSFAWGTPRPEPATTSPQPGASPIPVAPAEAPRAPRPPLMLYRDGPAAAPTASPESTTMTIYREPLLRLYERFDTLSAGRTKGDVPAAHQAILERLASNRADAESQGWTAIQFSRLGGMGRLGISGMAPGATTSSMVPDLASGESSAQ
jgi:hypothetical protein